MLNFNDGAVRVLAADIRGTLADIDRTLASSFKTSGIIPEVFENSNTPAGQSQKIYQRMSDSISQIVAGRGQLVSTIAHLRVLHQNSNVAETDFGCGDWGALFTGATLETQVTGREQVGAS